MCSSDLQERQSQKGSTKGCSSHGSVERRWRHRFVAQLRVKNLSLSAFRGLKRLISISYQSFILEPPFRSGYFDCFLGFNLQEKPLLIGKSHLHGQWESDPEPPGHLAAKVVFVGGKTGRGELLLPKEWNDAEGFGSRSGIPEGLLMSKTSFQVAVTDFTFGDLAIEQSVVEAAGGTIVSGQCKTEKDVAKLAAGADAVIVQFAPCRQEAIGGLKKAKVVVRYGIEIGRAHV